MKLCKNLKKLDFESKIGSQHQGVGCWANTDLFVICGEQKLNGDIATEDGDYLRGYNEDLERSRSRIRNLNSNPPTYPETWNDCNDRQKRLVLYHKVFRLLYKIGKRGVRVRLPSCIVGRIKRRWKYNIVADEGVVESL